MNREEVQKRLAQRGKMREKDDKLKTKRKNRDVKNGRQKDGEEEESERNKER